ncbi:MAG TPA: alpha/beta hydrolase [Oculatellaceae cyanobacterium]|jgi:pimeloyl-ACP methyl ester carboxylesterase
MATIDILGVPHTYDLTTPTRYPDVLVFIHGWLLSRRYWQPLVDELSPDYQCLVYDLRGFGDSQPKNNCRIANGSLDTLTDSAVSAASINDILTSRYTPAAYAEDLGVLLEKLNISSAWLVGHSLGGSIALWGASQLTDKVKGVICLNAGGGIYLKEAFEKFRSAGQQFLKHRPRWLCYMPGIDVLFTRANVARPIARCWGRQRLIDFVVAHPEAALGTLLDSTTEVEVNRLPQVVSCLEQPVYFITGAQDTVMEPKYVRHLASFHTLFQDCGDNVIEIAECGHLAMLEQPKEVAAQIRKLLI